jgi:hypothetical protein
MRASNYLTRFKKKFSKIKLLKNQNVDVVAFVVDVNAV